MSDKLNGGIAAARRQIATGEYCLEDELLVEAGDRIAELEADTLARSTKKEPPFIENAKSWYDNFVLAYEEEREAWREMHWEQVRAWPDEYPYWMPRPIIPDEGA